MKTVLVVFVKTLQNVEHLLLAQRLSSVEVFIHQVRVFSNEYNKCDWTCGVLNII